MEEAMKMLYTTKSNTKIINKYNKQNMCIWLGESGAHEPFNSIVFYV